MLANIVGAQSSYAVIHNFGGQDGVNPTAPLLVDKAGNMYGTDLYSAFKLSTGVGGVWTASILASIPAGSSFGKLIFDKAGNLYGTTVYAGIMSCGSQQNGCGTVFELTPNPDGTWASKTLYSFTDGSDGAYPYAGLTIDNVGNLYGTTSQGGTNCTIQFAQCGVVFELTPNGDGTWTQHVLHNFTGANDGANPFGNLVFHKGLLYGTTASNVFSLKRGLHGVWTETVLHTFQGGNDGSGAMAGGVFDRAGNLYGTTSAGGGTGCYQSRGCGTIYQLKPNLDGTWTESVLYRFQGGSDGDYAAYYSLILDNAGDLYGTTIDGGDNVNCIGGNCGTAFELTPGANGQWSRTMLYQFTDNAYQPAGLAFGKGHHLYGTTSFGGSGGEAFEIVP
jgi:uncharacterized repeat protein (TIGR03803 family)